MRCPILIEQRGNTSAIGFADFEDTFFNDAVKRADITLRG